jgi:hypothetical protein
MMKRLLVGLAALAASAALVPANALPVTGTPTFPAAVTPARFHGSAHRFGSFHRFGGVHHFHGFRRGVIIGAPVYYYGYGGCAWLRHRALVTGSPYWWHRYHRCRYGW